MSDFGEAAQGFLHRHELLPKEVEGLENVHGIEFFSDAIQALAEIALAGERQMVGGVVTAELLAAQGNGAAAPPGSRNDEGALANWLGAAA